MIPDAFDNAAHPFGSARFAEPKEIARAGLFTRQPHSLLAGFVDGQPLWYSDMGGAMCVAGPRSGKLRDLIAYNICAGIHTPSMAVLDIKGELAAISRNQTGDQKFCLYWNPHELHSLPQDRINPLSPLHKNNRFLISDVKRFALNAIPPSGSPHGNFFEGRAREVLEALCLILIIRDGMLTYPALYRAINLLVMGGDEWLNLAFEMSESDIELVRRIEGEIAEARSDSSGGIKGILGELTKAFACLSDPVLMGAVSPPFTAGLEQLFESDQTYQLYLMPPGDMAEPWAAVIKSFFVALRTLKARAPAAPRITIILDEIGNLGAFPLALNLFTRDAGIGVRPWGFWQSTEQMKALGKGAEKMIPASSGLQNWFGVRDPGTANALSRILGHETLAYRDEQAHERALHEKRRAAQALFQSGDPFKAAIEMRHHARMAEIPARKQRPLKSPDEVRGLPPGKQIIFADGLAHPILADRLAYYEMPFMAGRYHPNPYFPPETRVQIMTPRGPVWRPVVTEPVPQRFAHYPQYQDGTWSYIA